MRGGLRHEATEEIGIKLVDEEMEFLKSFARLVNGFAKTSTLARATRCGHERGQFPYNASRRVYSRRPRVSKNGTSEERAAKAAPGNDRPSRQSNPTYGPKPG